MFEPDFTVTIGGFRTKEGKRDIVVRWPSDQEWSAHHKRTKLFQRNFGRGVGQSDLETGDADAKLYESIKMDGAPALTVGEASFLIKQINRCTVMNVELRDDDAEVQLETLAGEAKHTVRIPNMDEIRALQKTNKLMSLPNNVQEIRTSMESSAALWDKCGGRVEGREGPVPIIYKDVAIRAVIQAIENEASANYGEGNF
ncbi:MAG TPA: hypothetical protein VHT68_15740 [Pseudolabrys sp.]|jgi:hypothetical protein|nr:hypothetical protein [Pseudolabrys sp.]